MRIYREHDSLGEITTESTSVLTLDVDYLARMIADDIVTGDHAYAEKLIPFDALVDIITHNLQSLLTSLNGGSLDLDPARDAGRVKAENGVDLSGVLHAYRLAGLRLWRELAARSDTGPLGQNALFQLGAELWSALDELSTVAAEAHRRVTDTRDRWAEQSRVAAVADLLSPIVTPQRREAASRLLHLNEATRYYVIVTDEQASGVEVLGARTNWAEINGDRVCLLALRGTGELLVTTNGAKAGVSEEFRSLDDAAEAERQARIALKCLDQKCEGIYHYGQSPIDTLICSQPAEARRLVKQTFAELTAMPHSNRDLLLYTFDAWAKNKGSVSAASQMLRCHRNTVNYRLRKFETLTARSIADPADLTVLMFGLQAIRLLGWPKEQ